MNTPTCHTCKRDLVEGESAWADDFKFIDRSGIRVETRYTCDQCAAVTS